MIVSHASAGPSSTAWAARGVITGRHYWELTLAAQPGESFASTWTSAGIAARQPGDENVRLRTTRIAKTGELIVQPGRDRSIINGDTLMFAIDADRRMGYWGHNGQWRNGVPGESDGTPLRLEAGEQFFAFAGASGAHNKGPEGDRWVANFGGRRFKYAIPAGYDSYGASAGAQLVVAPSPAHAGEAGSTPGRLSGQMLQGVVQVGGQAVPLPAGQWRVLAAFKGSASSPAEAVLLGQFAGKAMYRMVAVNAAKGASATVPYRSCLRQDVFFQSNQDARADVTDCWWVNHATQLWEQQNLFKAGQLELAKLGIQPSAVFINVGFHRSGPDGFVTAFYYFDPLEDGFTSSAVQWDRSEWHKSRIDADRTAYARRLVEWGRNWLPIFHASR